MKSRVPLPLSYLILKWVDLVVMWPLALFFLLFICFMQVWWLVVTCIIFITVLVRNTLHTWRECRRAAEQFDHARYWGYRDTND